MYQVVGQKSLADSIVMLDIEAPAVAAKAKPGEFVIVRQFENSERIPLTIMDFDRVRGTVTIVVQDVGYSSALIAKAREGEAFVDFVGPLGRPTEIENYGTVLCVGGGLGIAPIFPIARALKEAGNHVISVLGARSKDLLILEEEMAGVSSEMVIMTDDGSHGQKGFVTHGIQSVLDRGVEVDVIWAIGPMIMMRSVANFTRPLGIKTIVSMNPIMVDGTGMCGACRLEVGGEMKFACVEGPEFDGHLVDFELAMKRAVFFKEEEALAYTRVEDEGEGN
ncbi:MAG: sulfide/dihydroorotate dehydrogenase-like FAD/NAD-binding protein [Peptococcaceae bacterium]|nr:sulfide/dihydroorotate dehydrogenase-like FAD/NAD-binding protein [Peptococcaceae bacterium]